jgi:hypothetical protein
MSSKLGLFLMVGFAVIVTGYYIYLCTAFTPTNKQEELMAPLVMDFTGLEISQLPHFGGEFLVTIQFGTKSSLYRLLMEKLEKLFGLEPVTTCFFSHVQQSCSTAFPPYTYSSPMLMHGPIYRLRPEPCKNGFSDF